MITILPFMDNLMKHLLKISKIQRQKKLISWQNIYKLETITANVPFLQHYQYKLKFEVFLLKY